MSYSEDAEPGEEWLPHVKVGRYSLLSKIATGGMAEIWLARQAGLRGFEKWVVVKRISDSFSADPQFAEMFVDEARLAANLSHANIVQVFDLGEHGGALYMAMEYLPGEHLGTIVRAGLKAGKVLPIPYAVRVIADAAEGLAYAHAKTGPSGEPLKIVHRDVSPQNLIVTYDGQVKIVDFGIAKAATRSNQTNGGQLKGKTAYMSPEQVRGQPLDGRSDLFALGVVLFELVTRKRLFLFDDPVAAMRAVASEEPVPLAHTVNPEVPATLALVLSRALARNVADRYPTARAFKLALEDWLRKQPEEPTSAELGTYMHWLFAERIQERQKLLEMVSASELTPARVKRALGTSDTQIQLPAVTAADKPPAQKPPGEAPAPARKAPPTWQAMAAGVLGAVILLAGAAVWLRRGAAEQMPCVLRIQTDPAGASLTVNGAPVGKAPLAHLVMCSGAQQVAAELEGYQRASREVSFHGAGEQMILSLSLAPAAPVAAASKPVEETPSPTPEPAQANAEAQDAPATADATARAKARQAAAKKTGKLSLDSVPWTRVYRGSKLMGDTPLVSAVLPAGRHQLRLVNEEKKIAVIVEVDIAPGKTTVKKFRF